VCPLSNVKLCVFDTLAEHNLVQMLRAGLKVTINSDDPAYFGGSVNTNFRDCLAALPLTRADAHTLLRNSFLASFLPAAEKARFITAVDAMFEVDPE
jgi:adenosine deaminase